MTVFEEAVNGYAELSKEFKGKSPTLDRCGQILGKLKIALTQLSFLPNEEAPSNKVNKKISQLRAEKLNYIDQFFFNETELLKLPQYRIR